jgi:hypothetical protein
MEADQLLFRLGAFFDWEEAFGSVQLRGALVYGTNTGFQVSMPAFEVDLEPDLSWRPLDADVKGKPGFATKYLSLGYQNILIHRKPDLKDKSDNSWLDYQLRVYLHVEGGNLQGRKVCPRTR